MPKFGYYGVYGKNAAGVFSNYDRVLVCQKFIHGMKIKKFMNKEDAVDFIINGLCEDYRVISLQNLNIDLLYEKTNWNYNINDLRKRKIIAVINTHISREFLS